jgi:hypothetical protein
MAALADDADEEARRGGEQRGVVGARAQRVGVAHSDVEVPTVKKRMMMPIISPMSPVRVVRNGLEASGGS